VPGPPFCPQVLNKLRGIAGNLATATATGKREELRAQVRCDSGKAPAQPAGVGAPCLPRCTPTHQAQERPWLPLLSHQVVAPTLLPPRPHFHVPPIQWLRRHAPRRCSGRATCHSMVAPLAIQWLRHWPFNGCATCHSMVAPPCAAQVFRPGHLPPTRTLAEQADIEVADAQRRAQVGGGEGHVVVEGLGGRSGSGPRAGLLVQVSAAVTASVVFPFFCSWRAGLRGAVGCQPWWLAEGAKRKCTLRCGWKNQHGTGPGCLILPTAWVVRRGSALCAVVGRASMV